MERKAKSNWWNRSLAIKFGMHKPWYYIDDDTHVFIHKSPSFGCKNIINIQVSYTGTMMMNKMYFQPHFTCSPSFFYEYGLPPILRSNRSTLCSMVWWNTRQRNTFYLGLRCVLMWLLQDTATKISCSDCLLHKIRLSFYTSYRNVIIQISRSDITKHGQTYLPSYLTF